MQGKRKNVINLGKFILDEPLPIENRVELYFIKKGYCIMWFRDRYGRNIELTEERWQHIIKEHPELKGLKNKIGEVLLDPDYIKRSKRDPEVELFYKFKSDLYNGKFLLVPVKINKRCFVLTAYITDTIRKGDTRYDKKTENVL